MTFAQATRQGVSFCRLAPVPIDMDQTIFVISPIGADNSPQRIAADQLLKYVITPVAKQLGYQVQRADKLDTPGTISTQIIRYLIEARLVVADMTGHNPNVFYELAVRHAAKKPIVHMIANGEQIPFDVAPQRAIFYELDLDGVDAAKTTLERQAKAAVDDAEEPETPLANALQRIALAQSGEPTKQLDSKILDLLEDIRLRVSKLETVAARDSISDSTSSEAFPPSLDNVARWWLETTSFFDFVLTRAEDARDLEVQALVADEIDNLMLLIDRLSAIGILASRAQKFILSHSATRRLMDRVVGSRHTPRAARAAVSPGRPGAPRPGARPGTKAE